MMGVICKVVSCPFYCQGFCGNRLITVNAQGVWAEVARAQRVGWEPHSLVDDFGSRVNISVVEKEDEENGLCGIDGSTEQDNAEGHQHNTGDVDGKSDSSTAVDG